MDDTGVVKRKRGRPRKDPASFCDPAELVRRPLGLFEPDDARAARFRVMVSAHELGRPVTRWAKASAAERATETEALSGWVIVHEGSGAVTDALVRGVRARAPTVPVFVSTPEPSLEVNAICALRGAGCLLWPADVEDVTALLRASERFEVALVSHLAYVVRLAQARRESLQLHEAELAVRSLDGVLIDRGSCSVRSRTLEKLGVKSFAQLHSDRRSTWLRYGAGARADWIA